MERQISLHDPKADSSYLVYNYSPKCIAWYRGELPDYIGGGRGWKWNSAERIKFRGCESTRCSNTLRLNFRYFAARYSSTQKRSDLSSRKSRNRARNFRIKYDRSSVISIDRNSILPYERPLYTVLLCVFILGKSFRGKLAAIDRLYPFRYSFLRTARGEDKGSLGITELCLAGIIYWFLFYCCYSNNNNSCYFR